MPELAAMNLAAALIALGCTVALAVAGWLVSLVRHDVSIVDSLWSLMFLLSLGAYLVLTENFGWRAWLTLSLASIWALRLSAHITIRSLGEPEDRRYQEIRANNQPGFRYKSLYLVFGLQAILAWLIGIPLLAATASSTGPSVLDAIGVLLWLVGMAFEVVGDAQLRRFRRNRANRGKVLDTGLWRYTRHPNYFGEFLLHWGFYLIAAAAGGAWTVFAPLMMTFLLLRVSGVSLLEKDIAGRRPGYRRYARETNAFFPGKPRRHTDHALFIGLVLIAFLPGMSVPSEADGANREWNFQVFVDDKPVGYHRFELEKRGEIREIRSIADFEYRLLFLKLYDYRHENHELWQGECLERIESTTEDNGNRHVIDVTRHAAAFVVEDGARAHAGRQSLPACVKTFAYWNPDFLEAPRLLNSQTGEYMEADLGAPVRDEFEVNGTILAALRYRLEAGEYRIDLWYTSDEEWIGLQSQAGEGRRLRYVLQ